MAEEVEAEQTTCVEAIAELVRIAVSLKMHRVGAMLAMNAVETLSQSNMYSRAEEISIVVKNIISAYTSLVVKLYEILPDVFINCAHEQISVKDIITIIRKSI